MLANVLGVYLGNVKEREFDLPFITLLRASSFYDIHYTHSNVEYGKDFIAKNNENGISIQYSFQIKAGDISQAIWRNDVMTQMLESLLIGLSHPNFDRKLNHRTVLVTTGKLHGNVALGLQDLNVQIQETHKKNPILLWDREDLIQLLEIHGLGSIYQANASGFLNYGAFYQLYGKNIQGNISQREIEKHSRQWLDDTIPHDKRLLCSTIESCIFSVQYKSKGFLYEAIYSHLTVIRNIMQQIFLAKNRSEVTQLQEVYSQAISILKHTLKEYLNDFKELWEKSGRNLSSVQLGPNNFIMYFIHCSRIMEATGCLYFLESEKTEKEKISSFLADFVTQEPGCAFIPSDYYAVSLVLPILSLCSSGLRNIAERFLEKTAIWLCDRYQDGFGLADISAEPYEEIITLFGYPFEFIRVQPRKSSFIASVICDLANFIAKADLYTNIVNDIKAVKIVPQYWQVPDTASIFSLEGEDIVNYPNIEYSDDCSPFESFKFADHITHEPLSFSITNITGTIGPFFMMLLLRDRYFPSLWLKM